jgi:acyl-CoA synthetase (AMP-forming)/AMP-acid ligase II
MVTWIEPHLRQFGGRPAFVFGDAQHSYDELLQAMDSWHGELKRRRIPPGAVVAVIGDYTLDVVALLLSLALNRNVVVPLTRETAARHRRFFELAAVRFFFDFSGDSVRFDTASAGLDSPLIERQRQQGEPGVVLFTSGTTGDAKGAVLGLSTLLAKFRGLPAARQRPYRTALFLKLDHIGGLNTLFATLFNGGVAIPQNDRSAVAVCDSVQRHRIELLPTTPTFLNMLAFAGLQKLHALGSLKLVTYGTEPMPASTLSAATAALPGVRFKQTYGSTELGIFSTRSESSSSPWLQISADDAQFKVVNDTLWIRSSGAMLGYLNAPHPFDADGWFDTGDQVLVRGDYIRILGRKSELINVGGEKVHPAEIESVLLEMENVREAVVYAKASPVTGHIVGAVLELDHPESRIQLQRRVFDHCSGRMPAYKVPKFVTVADKALLGDRLKKTRSVAA